MMERDQEFEAKAVRSGLCELIKNIISWLYCSFQTEIVCLHSFIEFSEVKGQRTMSDFWFVCSGIS